MTGIIEEHHDRGKGLLEGLHAVPGKAPNKRNASFASGLTTSAIIRLLGPCQRLCSRQVTLPGTILSQDTVTS